MIIDNQQGDYYHTFKEDQRVFETHGSPFLVPYLLKGAIKGKWLLLKAKGVKQIESNFKPFRVCQCKWEKRCTLIIHQLKF